MQSRKDEQATARGDGLELTGREREIVTLLARGYSNKEIAGACAISPATVKHHVHHILQKLNVQRRGQIAKIAMKQP
jgi:DNA-binding NarL/FixJ family response regulator